jgi:hypothetical protein
MRRHAPVIQEARGRQYERAGTNRRHPPHPRRHRTHPFDEERVLAGLLGIFATCNDQSVQTISYVTVTVARRDLDSTLRSDRSRGGGYDIALVAGFVGSSEPCQPVVRVVECVEGTAHSDDFTTREYQESDPAGPCGF